MRWLPARDFWPFWPRPDVLPLPEPSPRPTRLRSRWLPSAGRSWCSPGAAVVSSAIDLLHLHERVDAAQHALQHRRVVADGLGVDLAQAERAQRAAMLRPDAGGAAHLGDAELRHQASSPPSGFSSAALSASAFGDRLRGALLGFASSAGAASASAASGSAAASSFGSALGSAFGLGAAFGLAAAFGLGAAFGLAGSGGAAGASGSATAAAASASAFVLVTTSECGLITS